MQRLFNWHWLSWVAKAVIGIVVLLLSAILSYAFFQSIEPAGMAVFPFAALSLTEFGFVIWLLIFTTMKHHPIKGLIALIMIVCCLVTTITVTFAELIQMFQDHTLVSNATVQNGVLILLEAMLGLHIIAAASDFLIEKIETLLTSLPPLPQKVLTASMQEPKSIDAPRDTEEVLVPLAQNGHAPARVKRAGN